MEMEQSDEEKLRKSESLRDLATRGRLPISIAKLSASSRVMPSETDFHFYNNFPEFKKLVKEIDQVSKKLLINIGASEDLFRNTIRFPEDDKMEVDDDVASDWLENVNDEFYERFDASVDEFKMLRKEEEESGVRKMRVIINDDSENGFRTVYGKKNRKLLGLEGNVKESVMTRASEVRVAEKVKPKVPFHIPTIPRPQDKYKIIVNNWNQPFEHVWLEKSEDGSTFVHPLEKLSLLDFIDESNEIIEPVKPSPVELTLFTLVENLSQLKQLAAKLHYVNEFAVDLEHNHYRSFLGLTCLMQISTRTEDFIIDTLNLHIHIGPHLREVFEDPSKRKVMHGADRDIIWLQRDFGIYVCNMFDTGQASRVLKMERNSLEHLLNHFCGVAANKEYQNADWRLRPLPQEMIRYAREDTHYLLYIYDVMKTKLIMSSAESESLDAPLIEVYKRSYDICRQLYEKELITSDSYLYIYGLENADLDAKQLAVVSGLCEWRDTVARAEDESTGYVLPNRTLIEIAKQMPFTASKLRHILRSKHLYVEQNVGSIVSIIKHCIQNANSYEKAVEYLKQKRLEMMQVNVENALNVEESELSAFEEPEMIEATKKVDIAQKYNLPNDHKNPTSVSSLQCKNESQDIGSSNSGISTDLLKFEHYFNESKGKEKHKTDCCAGDAQTAILFESLYSVETQTGVNLLQKAETTVEVQRKPSRAFGALFGNPAKRKHDPDKMEREERKLEQIKSTVSLQFHTFSGNDDKLQSNGTTEMPDISPHVEADSTTNTGSTIEDIIVFADDSDVEELAKGNSDSASKDELKSQKPNRAGSMSEPEEDEPMSLSDLSSHLEKCFPTLEQTKISRALDFSKPTRDFLQLEPINYSAARKQINFGEFIETPTHESDNNNERNRSRRERSAQIQSPKDENNTDLPQGRRRLAFPASGNRRQTFR